MIGDQEWREGLWHGYQQHVADSARHNREPVDHDRWAASRTWTDFVRLARLVLALPDFAMRDWETRHPIAGGSPFRSTVLARRLISALVMIQQLLQDLKEHDKAAWQAVRWHLEPRKFRRSVSAEALNEGQRYVYEWLLKAAQQDEVGHRRLTNRAILGK